MPNTPEPEATPELVDDSNPEARRIVAELDEVVALLAAELLGGSDA